MAEGGGLLSRHISSRLVPNSAAWSRFVGVFAQRNPLFSRPIPASHCQFGCNFGCNFWDTGAAATLHLMAVAERAFLAG